jgi:hypothetical protein
VRPAPFVRRVVEPWRTLATIPGARLKRLALSRVGRRAAARQQAAGLPGAEWTLGITDPPFVRDPRFFRRWLARSPGRFVELTCHPGFLDATLDGRDGSFTDGQLHRRQRELELLRDPGFRLAVESEGFTLVTGAEMAARLSGQARQPVRMAG